jgi:hypothetical protein
MSNRGLMTMDLTCPEGHVAGQLVQDAGQPTFGIQVPDGAREGWPRGGDSMYTYLTCPGCHRRVYGSTEAIQERALWLSESESQSQGKHSLRYLEDSLT